jgi:AraC family transcriptional regulator, alkane utilization regulator
MDALSELLRDIHLSGSAYIDADLSASWAIETPDSADIAQRVAPGGGRIIPYHMIVEGGCVVQVEGCEPITLETGEVVVIPHGDVHVLSSKFGVPPLRFTADAVVEMIHRDAVSRVKYGGDGNRTRLVCGFFACDRTLSDHLILPLPHMFKFRVRGDSTAAFLPFAISQSEDTPDDIANPGAQAVLCKLSELLFVDAVRSYAETLTHEDAGWLSGIKDRYVSHALALMHQQPGTDWTLDTLAHKLGTSRTTLSDHFVRHMGRTPMQYLSEWRLRLAADTLANSDHAIKKVAADAGFNSTTAFSRAFKRELGVSPGEWRRGDRSRSPGENYRKGTGGELF